MRRPDQKSFGVDINSKLLDEFIEQYSSRGFKKYRALEGAIRLWLTLASHEQSQWITGKAKPEAGIASDDEILADLDRLAHDVAAMKAKIRRIEVAKSKTHRPQRSVKKD